MAACPTGDAAEVAVATEEKVAATAEEAFLDCARYADGEDLIAMQSMLDENPNFLNCSDELGRTGCHMAAANGNVNVLKMLISKGAEPLKNHEGNTALHYAAVNNHIGAAKVLLEARRWKVSDRNALNRTALQEIGEKEFDEMEMLLLQHDDELDRYQCPAATVLDVPDDVEATSSTTTTCTTTDHTTDAAPATTAAASHDAKAASSAQPSSTAASSAQPSMSALIGNASVDDVE